MFFKGGGAKSIVMQLSFVFGPNFFGGKVSEWGNYFRGRHCPPVDESQLLRTKSVKALERNLIVQNKKCKDKMRPL